LNRFSKIKQIYIIVNIFSGIGACFPVFFLSANLAKETLHKTKSSETVEKAKTMSFLEYRG